MNGVHDMGGMHGMGPIDPEPDEPVFHHDWERRVLALSLTAGAGRWNIDAGRHQIEKIPAPEYLRMTYYEKWFRRTHELLIATGGITEAEFETGRPDPGSAKETPRLTGDRVAAALRAGGPVNRETTAAPAFQPGDRVRCLNLNPTGHTRLPRYAKDRTGVIERWHGAHVFPDTNAHFQGENPQHLYTVRFAARELWGDAAAPKDHVFADLWESYLERA